MTRTYCQMPRFGISTKLHIRFKLKIAKSKLTELHIRVTPKIQNIKIAYQKESIIGPTVRRHKHVDKNTPAKEHFTKVPTSKEHLAKAHTIFISHEELFFKIGTE